MPFRVGKESEYSVRVVFLADTHLGFDWPMKPRVDYRRRGEDFFNNYRKVLKYAVKNEADMIIHGGDVFFRRRVASRVVDLCYKELLQVAEQNIQCFLVPGNHDGGRLPVSIYMNHPNINVFERPRTQVASFRDINVAISGFPFMRHHIRERIGAIVEDCHWSQASAGIRLLCLHQVIQGAIVGTRGYRFTDGDDVIRRADILPVFCGVFAGHIHRAQIMRGQDAMPIVYAGSIERTSFAEKDEEKGFFDVILAPTETGRGRIRKMNFVALPTRPMQELVLDLREGKQPIQIQIHSSLARLDPNAIVRVRCTPQSSSLARQKISLQLLRRSFPRSMTIQIGSDFYEEHSNR